MPLQRSAFGILAGARVLHVPGPEPTVIMECPAGIAPYEQINLTAQAIVTSPTFEHPDLQATFRPPDQDLRTFLDHPVNADPFVRELAERSPGPRHQVGGYATPIQGPVEDEVSRAAIGDEASADGAALAAEAARWTLLAQIDSDDRAGMMWGDVGTLYWLTRREDLVDGRVENSSFTWQCA
jgi:hypothetical protein